MRALLAQDCVLCRAASGDALFCPPCRDDLPRLSDACPRCAGPSAGGDVCGACMVLSPSFDATLAVWRYEFPIDRLVQALKFGGRLALAKAFGEALVERVTDRSVEAIVPMPLAPMRLAERGFNQAMEIARWLERRNARALQPELARRARDTVPQTDLPHDAREHNIRNAFASSGAVAGMRLAVVDDVMTTGASLEELARTLKRAGAIWVENWVVARTWSRQRSPFSGPRARPAS